VLDNCPEPEKMDLREVLLRARINVFLRSKKVISHFLLESYADTEFASLSKLNDFEKKIASTASQDCKLVKVESGGDTYYEKQLVVPIIPNFECCVLFLPR
jgi:hypothetical protein